MSKIATYPSADTPLQLSDRLIGTEAVRTPPSLTPLATKNFSLGELLQLFSSNFPAASLQAVLNSGNTATQNITLVGTINATLIKPTNIEDTSGSQGTVFQYLSKGASSISWVDLPVSTLQDILNSGNTATQNITLIGNITSTIMIPGNIQDELSSIGATGQLLSKTATGIRWINTPIPITPGLGDVLATGNTAINDINLTGNFVGTSFIKTGGTSLQYLMADGSVTTGGSYTLPVATLSTLGGVKIGSGVSVALDGTISVSTNYQAPLSGTGFVKISGTTISYDNSTYYLASNPSGFTSNLGTVTSVAALTLGTIGTDLSSTVATGTTTPVITLNIPTASALNRGALSSTDWTTFNNKQEATASAVLSTLGYYNYKNTTSSSPVTGTLTETPLIQVVIPPNTFAASDFFKFTATFLKVGTLGSIEFKTKISTLSTMPIGTTGQISTTTLGAANLTTQINRRLAIKGGNIVGFPRTSNAASDFAGSTLTLSSAAFDTTVTQYFYISATLLNITDSVSLDSLQITNI